MAGTMHPHSHLRLIRKAFIVGISCMSLLALQVNAESKFQDPLNFPAQMRSSIAARPLMAVAYVGEHLVAVGSRGLIIRSEDQGKSWNQSVVPVQCDLLSLHFPNPSDGWAVGHDGVVLHTADGGKSWVKQLDGRISEENFKQFYAAGVVDPATQAATDLITQNFKAGPALPWLDVWFEDASKGFVVGSFGMIAATADGGKTWEPWLHRIENDQSLNLNSIRRVGDNIYIVGERGMVFKLDRINQRFKKIATGYAGSFFGITGNTETLLAFGLRGVAYRTGDAGKNWEALKMPAEATITGAIKRHNPDGFVLINSAGQLLVSDDSARQFQILETKTPMRYTGVAQVNDGSLVVTGLGGVHTEALNSINTSSK